MMSKQGVNQTNKKNLSVADPNSAYESMKGIWTKNRAVCSGERFVKEYDAILDVNTFSNLLIPFSGSMTQEQYNFYKAEAELPGIVSEYSKFIVGGLLRKKPQVVLPDGVPEDAADWLVDQFAQDGAPLTSFLDEALWEEVQTGRAWIYVDHPVVPKNDAMTQADYMSYKPFPVLWNAESVVNWKKGINPETGVTQLERVVVRKYVQQKEGGEDDVHPELKDTVYIHEVIDGKYQIRVFEEKETSEPTVVAGRIVEQYMQSDNTFALKETITNILCQGAPLTFIPAWPLNGNIDVTEPMLSSLINKEVSLYNKLSRRNHLLYGASTYTPYIAGDMTDEDFEAIVNAGLGSWFKIPTGATASILDTPTSALSDMDRAIAATVEDMAKMGIRMLSPEAMQSGVALEIRNAAQTARLGTLNMKVSYTLQSVIAFMIYWRYGVECTASDINFTLSSDFNPAPLGDAWLRLVTEWYENGLIPRSVWLQILKQNDIVPPEYNDEEGQQEINSDELVITKREQQGFENALTTGQMSAQQPVV